jgi:hypothetical protein
VHFASQQTPAPFVDFGRRRARAPGARRVEGQRLGRQETADSAELLGKPRGGIECAWRTTEGTAPRRGIFEDESEQDESKVAVDRLSVGRVLER